jgi:hypothetical protein
MVVISPSKSIPNNTPVSPTNNESILPTINDGMVTFKILFLIRNKTYIIFMTNFIY